MNKIFRIISVCFVLVIVVLIGYVIWDNMTVATVTLDINPSIEINLNRHNKVKSVVALNEDAKSVISDTLRGKSLNDSIDAITEKIVEKGFVENGHVVVIMHSEGNVENKNVEEHIKDIFNEKQIQPEVIVINEISKEDEELAKKNNISVAKASYINTIVKENENIDVSVLVDKSVDDLQETKMTGKYCDEGYFLEGDFCFKEIERHEVSTGMVCPEGYSEYNNTCYEESRILDKEEFTCRDEFTLEGDKCIRKQVMDAEVAGYSCSSGMVRTKGEVGIAVFNSGDSKETVCVDTKTTTAVNVCNLPASDPTERMSYGGKCYWHRAPVIQAGCPGKIQVNGACWDDASNVYMCPGGYNANTRVAGETCYTVLKNVKPTVTGYKCEESDFTLNGKKCEKSEIEDAFHEHYCESGYTLIDNGRCYNLSKTADKISGYVCDGDTARIKNNMCITYDIVGVKQS